MAADLAVTGTANVVISLGGSNEIVMILAFATGLGVAKVGDNFFFTIGKKTVKAEGKVFREMIGKLSVGDATKLISGSIQTKQFNAIIKSMDDDVLKGVLKKLDNDTLAAVIKKMDAGRLEKLLKGSGDDLAKRIKKITEGGLKTKLLDELANSGVKYNPDDVVMITKTHDGKLLWISRIKAYSRWSCG